MYLFPNALICADAQHAVVVGQEPNGGMRRVFGSHKGQANAECTDEAWAAMSHDAIARCACDILSHSTSVLRPCRLLQLTLDRFVESIRSVLPGTLQSLASTIVVSSPTPHSHPPPESWVPYLYAVQGSLESIAYAACLLISFRVINAAQVYLPISQPQSDLKRSFG